MSAQTHRAAPLARLACFAAAFLPLGAAARGAAPQDRAREILQAAGVKGGLIVVVGWDQPDLLAAMRASDSYLVHGLDADPRKVDDARKHLQDKGLYGPITVSRLAGRRLPYVDNLINLIVLISDKAEISREEMIRAAAPGGAIVDARGAKLKVARAPRDEALGEWPHYLYDPSNNAVSSDTVVAPPRGLQWTCGPAYARSHEHFASVSAMVSAGGRVFYIQDEGPISSVFLPPKWRLVARDAFSGVCLWKRPIQHWESQLRGFRSGPPEIGRRLITDGERVYVALGYGQPATALDAATGKTVHTYAGTEGARELLHRGGVLYVLADDMTAEDHEARRKWINQTAPTLRGYQFPRKPIAMYGRPRIVAVKAQTGEKLWQKACGAAGEVMPATLAEAEGRVCYQSTSHVVCLDAATGKGAWRSDRPVARSRYSWSTPTLVVQDGVVLSADRAATDNADKNPPPQGSKWLLDNAHQSRKQDAEVVAFSLADGKELWRAPYHENYDTQIDVFVIDKVVWIGDLRHKKDPGFTQGRDLRTGKVVATVPNNQKLYSLQMGHHRCHRNKATVRYLILGRDGIEFVDPKAGTGSGNWWVRGTCQYGVMPANGLIYAPQHSCACHPSEKLNGFNVLSPRSSAAGKGAAEPAPLEKGPAFAQSENGAESEKRKAESGAPALAEAKAADDKREPIVNRKSRTANDTWPTYRRDARRSGFQDVAAPRAPRPAWTAKLAAPITAPVVAGGKVFVAETDRHAVRALSARDGKPAWSFLADGRIDSPPTILGGRCFFGTRSGFVYCLRASDGQLAWRFRAAPRERLLLAYEQLESAWPVHGSVLVDEEPSGGSPVVYLAAGRSSHLDGGIRLYALEAATGKVLHTAVVSMGAGAAGGAIKQRALPDVLSVQHGMLFMRDLGLGKDLSHQAKKVPHLYAPGGFLDDTWWHRTYWIYGTAMMSGYGGWPRVGNMVPAGRLLACDGGETIYGYGRMAYRAGAGHVHPDATKDYKLFAEVRSPKPKPAAKPAPKRRRRRGPARRREIKWSAALPFLARSLVLTRDALLVAGGRSLTESAADHGAGTFWIASRADGAKQYTCKLPAPPVLDGMALADVGVVISTIDGAVVCLRSAE